MVEHFLDYIIYEKRLSINTAQAYKADLIAFQSKTGKSLESCTKQDIQYFIITLVQKKLLPQTINRKITSIHCFYNFLLKKNIITLNPALTIKKIPTVQRVPQFLKQKDTNTFLNTIKKNSKMPIQEKIVLFLLYHTGIRLEELIELKIQDIYLHDNMLKVMGKGKKERIIPFCKELSSLMKEYLIEEDKIHKKGYFFTTKKQKKAYPMMVYRIVKKNLSSFFIHQKSPHVLRHTYATHLLQNGAEMHAIRSLLGHKTLAATQIYAHHTLDHLKKIFDEKHARA